MLRYLLRTALFLITFAGFQSSMANGTIPEYQKCSVGLKAVLCAIPQLHVFTEPPRGFSPEIEVSGCYCEYQDRLLLLLRNPEKPQGNSWCIPGGKLDEGETPLQAVIREVQEETGLLLSSDSLRYCLKVYVRFPNRDFILHLFRAELGEISRSFQVSSQEHCGYRWVTLEEAQKMPLIPGGSDCLLLSYHHLRFH